MLTFIHIDTDLLEDVIIISLLYYYLSENTALVYKPVCLQYSLMGW